MAKNPEHRRVVTNLEELSADPRLKKTNYDKNISLQEQDRKNSILQKGPCQPRMDKDDYPKTLFHDKFR